MPVYAPEDYETVLARIQKKLAAENIKLGPCLSEDAIAAFETACRIQLPLGYRMFLKQVGDGCRGYGLPLKRLCEIPTSDLSKPFQLREYWLWEDDSRDDAVIEEELNTKVEPGNIMLCDLGCSNCYHLIVTGACRGEVWNFTDVGVQPCCERQDFLGWFELWLDFRDETDYFKDFVYDEDA